MAKALSDPATSCVQPGAPRLLPVSCRVPHGYFLCPAGCLTCGACAQHTALCPSALAFWSVRLQNAPSLSGTRKPPVGTVFLSHSKCHLPHEVIYAPSRPTRCSCPPSRDFAQVSRPVIGHRSGYLRRPAPGLQELGPVSSPPNGSEFNPTCGINGF